MAGSYKVEYLETSPVTDITVYVHTLDDLALFTDGRISYAKLSLSAIHGQFMTDPRGGLTPLLTQFDRFKFTFTDSDGEVKTKIMELTTDLSQVTLQGDYLLPLEFEGRERHLGFIPFSGLFDVGITHYDILDLILTSYGFDEGTKQPLFYTDEGATDTNELPQFNPNIWDFQYIDNCLDAIKEVVKHANNSVPAGGAGDRFAIIFDDDPANPPTPVLAGGIIVRVIPQGSRNSADSPKPLIVNTKAVPIKKIDKIKHPLTGTKVIVRGRPGTGRTPSASDLYRGRMEFWLAINFYSDTIQYKTGAYVEYGEVKYVCILTPPTVGVLPTNATYWDVVTFGEYVGDFNYSQFTNDKATVYLNGCGNPQNAFSSLSPTSPKVFDCNLVITDNKTQRDWVIFRGNTDVVASLTANQKKYLHNETNFYPGFRILLDPAIGTLAGTFAAGTNSYGMGNGKDPRGVPFINNTVIMGEDLKWYVFNNPDPLDPDAVLTTPSDYQQIVVIYEGTIYEWNVDFTPINDVVNPADRRTALTARKRSEGVGTPDGWRNIGEEFLGSDCWHTPSIIESVDGLITPRIKTGVEYYTDLSGLRIVYGYNIETETDPWKLLLDKILGYIATPGGDGGSAVAAAVIEFIASELLLFTSPYYGNIGWWWTISAPFPFSTINTISEKVGELYGGGSISELRKHPFFDAYNQKYTLAGNQGWNQPDSKELMEITGVTFLYKLNIRKDSVNIPFTGDIPCSYWVIDNNGTIWKSKQTYRFLGDVQRFTFEFGDFTPVYRARTPFGIDNLIQNIIVPELEIRERLFPTRIKFQGFMLEVSYDEHGRYMPNQLEGVIKPTIITLLGLGSGIGVEFDGVIDDFAWTKTPIAISASDAETTKRTIVPEIKDFPTITNYEQLQRIADAELDIEEFPYEQYTILQNNKADLELQDTVYLEDDLMIDEEDLVGTPHTRELVVGEYHLSVTNDRDFVRTLVLIRRIPNS